MKNKFCWVELVTTNINKSKTFYEKLFNWKFKPINTINGSYLIFDTDNKEQGAIQNILNHDQSRWIPIIQVKNINQYIKNFKTHKSSLNHKTRLIVVEKHALLKTMKEILLDYTNHTKRLNKYIIDCHNYKI